MDIILDYFPNLTSHQQKQFAALKELYVFWNNQINVISRKDLDSFYEHHVLHSLAIAKIISFKPNTSILDVGTGGGFPGIPLAILFPEADFFLIDSIGKKIKVVNEISTALELKNIKAQKIRAEEAKQSFDFVITRAVAEFQTLYNWTKKAIKSNGFNDLQNGIIALKGGDLNEELKNFSKNIHVYSIKEWFKEPFFETKKIVYWPQKS